MSQRFAVLGIGLWSDRFASVADFIEGNPVEEAGRPPAALVPSRQRRRCSVLTRALATAFGEALAQTDLDPATLPTVCGSAWGECDTLPVLLEAVFDADVPMSPMRFAASVHNTASGTLSIATGARGFATSIAAGEATIASTILEAVGLLAAGHDVVAMLVGDSPIPSVLGGEADGHGTLAIAVIVGREGSDAASGKPLLQVVSTSAGPQTPVDPTVATHPCRHGLGIVSVATGAATSADVGPLHGTSEGPRLALVQESLAP